MATYNGQEFVEQQICSILSQLSQTDELVISDDGSTDGTLDIIASIADPRIRVLQNDNIHGIKGNIENALSHAKGDILFLSDQDDVWLPQKVEACREALKTCDLVLTNCSMTDKDLNIIESSFFEYQHSRSGLWYNILVGSYYGCCMAMRRHVIEAALPIPKNPYLMHDLWIGLVGEMTGKVSLLREPLMLYRRHDKAFTPQNEERSILRRSKRNLFEKLWSRVVAIYHVARFSLVRLSGSHHA